MFMMGLRGLELVSGLLASSSRCGMLQDPGALPAPPYRSLREASIEGQPLAKVRCMKPKQVRGVQVIWGEVQPWLRFRPGLGSGLAFFFGRWAVYNSVVAFVPEGLPGLASGSASRTPVVLVGSGKRTLDTGCDEQGFALTRH